MKKKLEKEQYLSKLLEQGLYKTGLVKDGKITLDTILHSEVRYDNQLLSVDAKSRVAAILRDGGVTVQYPTVEELLKYNGAEQECRINAALILAEDSGVDLKNALRYENLRQNGYGADDDVRIYGQNSGLSPHLFEHITYDTLCGTPATTNIEPLEDKLSFVLSKNNTHVVVSDPDTFFGRLDTPNGDSEATEILDDMKDYYDCVKLLNDDDVPYDGKHSYWYEFDNSTIRDIILYLRQR